MKVLAREQDSKQLKFEVEEADAARLQLPQGLAGRKEAPSDNGKTGVHDRYGFIVSLTRQAVQVRLVATRASPK